MVKIVDFKTYQKEDGTEFCALKVQGGIEAVKSKQTGKTYLTALSASVPCTFNAETCKSLIGTDFSGSVRKVKSEPYEYVIPATGEIVKLTHRFEYVSEEKGIVQDNVIEKEFVM